MLQSSRGASVSVVSALGVHFLTFIDNYPINQRANTAHISVSVVSVRANTICGGRFRCFMPFVVSGGKVKTFIPTHQTILQKSLVKKSFAVNTRRFCS